MDVVAIGQPADEQAHGEADAPQHGDAEQLSPGRAIRLAGELQADRGEPRLAHLADDPREIARRALELSASSIILVHNHPSGDPTPSKADVDLTREIEKALAAQKRRFTETGALLPTPM